jgi:hypothetical protein
VGRKGDSHQNPTKEKEKFLFGKIRLIIIVFSPQIQLKVDYNYALAFGKF